ncbi:MAG: bifunctional metallophosphatase/5'-nucleotidase, partial [Prochlorotrichaceae cyanobacterium]
TLELFHLADQEPLNAGAGLTDITGLSAVLNALKAQDVGNDGLADNTLILSSGDAIIPGLFYEASLPVFGSRGIADIQIQNELGVQAIAFGNHEFDFGTKAIADLISGAAPGTILGADFAGANFPYLSTNLDFSTDANLAPLEVEGGQAPQPNAVTSSTVIDVNGESIGVVGATTPTLATISSPGTVGISPSPFGSNPTDAELDALAAIIQAEVDALLAANPDMNKVVLLAHMQKLTIEEALATRLENVDIIVGGGSNTRLFDEDDRVRAGDSNQGEYPKFFTNAGGTQTVVVNTDGSYKYLGRLVIDFDVNGNIIPESYDSTVSGAYATDAQGVADLNAEGLVDPEIQAIVDAIEAEIIATESNVFGLASVFLNGNRSGQPTDGVRTQETNLGNLTADANLALAQSIDPTVVVSIKNGGGIRSSIGETIVPPGGSEAVRSPNSALLDSEGNEVKPEGGISENDIKKALAFNNNLSLLTLTRQELVAVLEHGVAGSGAPGQFPQVAGVKFSFDPDLPANDRLLSAGIFDEEDNLIAELVRDGELVGDPDQTFRIVTLGFLADGGDSYPFPTGDAVNRLDLTDLDGDGNDDESLTGDATFAFDGTEQDALAEYLLDNFATPETAFDQVDVTPEFDTRIQNLNFRED